MPKIVFLGAQILHYDCRDQDTDGLLRMDVTCDLTRPIAEKLGISSVFNVDCVKRIPLTLSDIIVTEIHMTCSGNESYDLQMLAHRIADFRVIRHEEEGTVERLLRFHVFAPEDCAPLVTAFRRANKNQKGMLTVELSQGELFEEQPAEAAMQEQKPKRGRLRLTQPPVASVREMEEAGVN